MPPIPWIAFASNATLLKEVSYCLGFFDGTRDFRLSSKTGDGSEEVTDMRAFADSYVTMLRKFDETGVQFANAAAAGRRDAEVALFSSVIGSVSDGRAFDFQPWKKTAIRCQAVRSQAKKVVQGKPDHPPLPVVEGSTTAELNVCRCVGELRVVAGRDLEGAWKAFKALTPAFEKAKNRLLPNECETTATVAEGVVERFPRQFIETTKLLDDCYQLASTR